MLQYETMDDPLQKLTALFAKFPGIGGRQARRFVYFLLSRDETELKRLGAMIADIKRDITQCPSCQRFFPKSDLIKESKECKICRDSARDGSLLIVVEKDNDLDSLEKSGTYEGHYFILGGTVPNVEKEVPRFIRIDALKKIVAEKTKSGNLQEIILGLSLTPAGEHTISYLRTILSPLLANTKVQISMLGRGLSTGTELEYSDSETLKNALLNRHKE